jgi:putative membrane-bound dehydrogenase-like protein
MISTFVSRERIDWSIMRTRAGEYSRSVGSVSRLIQGIWSVFAAGLVLVGTGGAALADDESYVFTPSGFARPGLSKTASGENTARLRILIRDRSIALPTACRINVIGPDGNFYQPAASRLSPYSLTGQWPNTGKGNREGKAPIRYFGRFFYAANEVELTVPRGLVRIEAWKGFEYRPVVKQVKIAAGHEAEPVRVELEHTVPMVSMGYYSGDLHLHLPRSTEADDQVIFNLLEAEDIHFGSLLAYNEPPGSYTGSMDAMATPQHRGLGEASARQRGAIWITSGQEYRSTTYGHLNLYWRSDLVQNGHKTDANNWPLFGHLGRETRRDGGYAVYAHGGYGQAIYSDFVQKNVDAVELLQFGVYRGIELAGWYQILNIGYRFPCVGASDYPACRKLGDCQTYVYNKDQPDFAAWLKGASEGRSFVTTGPLLILDVNGKAPGDVIRQTGAGPHHIEARVRATCEVAPIQSIQLIVNGKVVHERSIPPGEARGRWIKLEHSLDLTQSSWIAARASGRAPSGAPDAEAHTNPVYVYLDGKAPYDRNSLDQLVGRLDQQMAIHRERRFAEQARVLDDFQKSRDILLRIRQTDGLSSEGVPDGWISDEATAFVNPGQRAHSDSELARFLQPVPARSTDEALKLFETVDGFRIEPVATEPMVQSPVAAAFDADGNLYVAEMRDYPYKPKPGSAPLGTVRLLRDTDGDGRFDQSHIFADRLLWAAGIAPWKEGVFVTAPPDIWYLKDTDSDGKADVRQKVYTGFGTQNQQAMVNNLAWGLDHMIYGAAAGNGGTIRLAESPGSLGVSVDHCDFRFDPVTRLFEPVSGGDQFGSTFDDWGNRFTCDESHPLSQPVLPRRELGRNPFLAVPSAVKDIAGGAVPIFRISPIERWRQIRSSRRIAHGARPATAAGASHHVVDAGAGVTIYRGSAYPAEFYGNVFIGDAQNNLIHRRILVPKGPTFRAVRAAREQTTEFVRSSDNWFRPVNFVNAPDGTLYVLDMSRAVIEAIHIPLDVVKHIDLKRGRDQGRIYRIAPLGFRHVASPRLSQASTAELVGTLCHKNGWHRDTAHRLIYERQDRAAIKPLQQLLSPANAPLAQTRVGALWSLEGLKALRDEDIGTALADPVPQVRACAVQLAGRRLDRSQAIVAQIVACSRDPDPRVRFWTALALGDSRDPRVVSALLQIVQTDVANHWIRTAVLSSCAEKAGELLTKLWKGPDPADASLAPSWAQLLEQLAQVLGARRKPAEIGCALDQLATSIGNEPRRALRERLILELARGLRRSGGSLAVESKASVAGARLVGDLTHQFKTMALDERAAEAKRTLAIESLGVLNPDESIAIVPDLLEPRQPQAVQLAAARALANGQSNDVAGLLLSHLPQLGPTVRAAAIQTLLSRTSWTKALLSAASQAKPPAGVSATMIDAADRALLLKHRDPEVAQSARALFGQPVSGGRSQIIADYLQVLKLNGEPSRGAKIFERQCESCHKIRERGTVIGPDLSATPSGDSTSLLANILDPNASVQPDYVQYAILDQDGRTYSGIIAAETATSLTLRRGKAADETILRSQIAEISSTGMSLMPEGFEKTISKAEMADLVAFLRAEHRSGDDADNDTDRSRPLDIGTLPGLIEPDH